MRISNFFDFFVVSADEWVFELIIYTRCFLRQLNEIFTSKALLSVLPKNEEMITFITLFFQWYNKKEQDCPYQGKARNISIAIFLVSNSFW